MSTWSYYLPDQFGEGPEDAHELREQPNPFEDDASYVARLAAQEVWGYYDGAEFMADSEVAFAILRDGDNAGTFVVTTEFVETFHASPKKASTDG
jgi:hypothetical protein